MAEQIIRNTEARTKYFGVGHSQFYEDIVPRLTKVKLGKRAVGYTLSSIQRVIGEMVAETATAKPNDPVPNQQRRAGLPPKPKQAKRRAR